MRRLLSLLVLSTLPISVSAAEVTIPNTRVSYEVTKDPISDRNTSSIYLDEQSSDTYVEFVCTDGIPVFYLHTGNLLMTQAEYDQDKIPALTYRVDSQTARVVPAASLEEAEDMDDDTHLTSLAVTDRNDALMLSVFRNAQTRVALRVTRSGGRELTYMFPVRGFTQALKAVNNCR
ncbi:hypothetical protein GCM10008955_34140 [Deinococcus malanensis]|uniref:Uncharacterized protein n=1 Tax=Deinococcus malanensis TaxID=1706855 RepID=A0ABQ2F3A4_9DEIO|nr:hypothetical protein [Deinococcus malanensis]GGK37421.1 hypothetical protein GCM10008955_34140 [Deinococcus malanensis]